MRNLNSMRHAVGLAVLGILFAIPVLAKPMRKEVSKKWVWFTDYAYWSAEWTLNGEYGCPLEVGYGISFRGKPRGGTYRFSDYFQFSTYGIGAIKVRVVDGEGPCIVQLDQGVVEAIPIYSDPSLKDAAIEDARRARDAQKKRRENDFDDD